MATKRLAVFFQCSIIQPTLIQLGLWSVAAQELLLGTALIESNLTHRRRLGGPARGFFQMEPETHDDIRESFLTYRAPLAGRVKDLLTSERDDKLVELEVKTINTLALWPGSTIRCEGRQSRWTFNSPPRRRQRS